MAGFLEMLDSTGWIDKKIKNSFNNTSNMLTQMYSKSMPDLSSIGKPKEELTEKLVKDDYSSTRVANDYLTAVEIVDTEANKWSGYPSTKRYIYNKTPTLIHRPKSVPDFTEMDNEADIEPIKIKQEPDQLIDDIRRLQSNHLYQGVRDEKLANWLKQRDEALFQMANKRRSSKGFSAAEEYRKLLSEEKANQKANEVNNIYEPSYMKNKNQPYIADSLESFRFNERFAEDIGSAQSADPYTAPQKDSSSDAMSEPIQHTASSQYAPAFKPTSIATYEAHAMRDPSLLNRRYYVNSKSTEPIPSHLYSVFLDNNQEKQQQQQQNQNEDIGASSQAEVEVITYDGEQSENQQDDEEQITQDQNNDDGQEVKQPVQHKKGGYGELAMKRQQLKNKPAKRIKRNIESKPLHSASMSPVSNMYNTENEARYSDVNYNAYSEQLQRLMNEPQSQATAVKNEKPKEENSKYVYDDSPLTKKYFNSQPSKPATLSSPVLYEDSPLAKEYFNKKHNPLPPLKTRSQGNSPVMKHNHEEEQSVDPLAFKLTSSDVEQNIARRNKIQRQKEYAEILRHNQKEIAREKPQVRSWNKRNPDDAVYQESKRAAALDYANGIQKPVVKDTNRHTQSPPKQSQNQQDDLPDAIAIMRLRHEQEKQKIEDMRREILNTINSERAAAINGY